MYSSMLKTQIYLFLVYRYSSDKLFIHSFSFSKHVSWTGFLCIQSPSQEHWRCKESTSRMGYQSITDIHLCTLIHLGAIKHNSYLNVLGVRRPEESQEINANSKKKKKCTNLSSGLNWSPGSCEMATLLTAPPCHQSQIMCEKKYFQKKKRAFYLYRANAILEGVP